jgi:ATP-dependent DNA helicase RecG
MYMTYPVLPPDLLSLIQQGENISVEFKKSTTEITKDVYDTVCSFSNRDGGHIFLGVRDDGTILGIRPDCVDRMKKDFVTSVNNENKMYPPLYLNPVEYEYDEKIILYIRVPVSPNVCRRTGRIFDRINESDIDITNHADEVYRLYARKSGSYFVNKVTRFGIDALRPDLIERARKMTRVRGENHPWRSMSDEELLRSAGLILTDEQTQQEGITLAAILLFGKDSTIMSVLPQHKTDAIFRVVNTDRYDDRDVVITNLLESYDRLLAFGQKHLNDTFHLEGIQSVSARDHILREIISNLLAHRDYSSGYVAKFVIEKSRIYTENANLSHGHGMLNISTFDPFQKNPPISKVFREIGLADELGSGMRNTYKYTKMYSGGEPIFEEGDIFHITIPLSEVATATVGPASSTPTTEASAGASAGAGAGVSAGADMIKLDDEHLLNLLEFCQVPRTKNDMQEYCGIKSDRYFRKNILTPMLQKGLIQRTIPDKPQSPKQKYVAR